jgi:hypothetical protein
MIFTRERVIFTHQRVIFTHQRVIFTHWRVIFNLLCVIRWILPLKNTPTRLRKGWKKINFAGQLAFGSRLVI